MLSIVTVADGNAPLLPDGLAALQRQSYEHWEHIIFAAGESLPADLWEAAAIDPRLRPLEYAETGTPGQSWNSALNQISRRSQYCMFLDPGERLVPDALAELLAVAQRNPAAGVIGCRRARGDRIEAIPARSGVEAMGGSAAARLHLRQAPHCAPLQAALIQAHLVRSRPRFCSLRYQHPDVPAFFELMLRTDFAVVPQVLSQSVPGIETGSRERQITWIRDWLMCLHEYGHRYLQCDELAERQTGMLKLCHRALLRSMLSPTERQYLAYYLAQVGGTPGVFDLLIAASEEIAERVRLPFRPAGIAAQNRN